MSGSAPPSASAPTEVYQYWMTSNWFGARLRVEQRLGLDLVVGNIL